MGRIGLNGEKFNPDFVTGMKQNNPDFVTC